MKKAFDLELVVGIFVLAGILCLAYLSIRLGDVNILGKDTYEVYAIFSDVGDLRAGAPVVIAGVRVGKVTDISLDNYRARVVLSVEEGVALQEDVIASVKTQGLIGEKYVELTPGGAPENIGAGGRIRQTEPAVDLHSLIRKYAFGEI